MGKIGVLMVATCFLTAIPLHAANLEPNTKNREYYETRGDIVWEVPTHEKLIALTFDDGPDPADTPAILNLLKEYEAKATFFVIGKRAEQFPELIQREIHEGHEIANHTYSHMFFSKQMNPQKIEDEILKAEESISQVTGEKPHLFRPPGGYYGENLVDSAKKFRYQVILWSWHQDTEDWKRPGVHKIVAKVLNNARNGDIILFHDYVEGKTQTIEALKQILPELKERGYTFVTVSELMHHRKTKTVEN
jgi:peptidoglycan-N-acetylglucosamine deacetylase